jgi:phage gp45-like
MDFVRIIHQATASLRRRVTMMVSRIVVDAVSDATKLQSLRVQAFADEVIDPVEHFQPGGLSHVALQGAEGILVCAAGFRDHPLALGVSNRDKRPKGLLPGETVLYCASPSGGGVKIKLGADGNIELTPTGAPIAKVTVVGDLVVTGEVTAGAAVPAAGVKLTTHMHPGLASPPTPGS